MQKKTRSILEELETLYAERDQRHVIENRAANVIAGAIRLLEQIDSSYTAEQAENLQRKLITKESRVSVSVPNRFRLRVPDFHC